jgi:hypothetical protein
MQKRREFYSYLIGTVVSALVGATVAAFNHDKNETSIVSYVLFTAFGAIIVGLSVAAVIILISRLFGNSFSFLRLVRISSIVCFIWMFFTILSQLLS